MELNTFFLILKRQPGLQDNELLPLLFNASWALIRVLWFPIFAVYITFFDGVWPDEATHAAVGSCLVSLALLQWFWTWNAVSQKPNESH